MTQSLVDRPLFNINVNYKKTFLVTRISRIFRFSNVKKKRGRITGDWKKAQARIDIFELGYSRGYEDALYAEKINKVA